MGKYPKLIVDHNALRENMTQVVKWCKDAGIEVTGVISASGGMASVALDYEYCGAGQIASSGLEHLARAKGEGVKIPLMMIRTPMISELPELVEVCDYSLQSEFAVIKELEGAASAAGKVHNVILMADLGDLREGFFEQEELIDVSKHIEENLSAVHLAGIGTGLGCCGSIIPTEDKMKQLVQYAEAVEEAIGRPLEIISGGTTSSMLPLLEGTMPGRVNNLRIGEPAMCGLHENFLTGAGRKETARLRGDAFVLEAEVVEVRTKPTYPVGKIGTNAFGQKQKYKDRGLRRRALLAIGCRDFGDISNLIPEQDGAEIVGASEEYTIMDIENCPDMIRAGDRMRFSLRYAGILYASTSDNVNISEADRLYGIKI